MPASDRFPPVEEPLAARPAEAAAEGAATAGRSLVVLGDGRNGPEQRPSLRPSAAFLAHLIAVAQQVPQVRQRRRIEPQDGAATYSPPATARTGRSLSRSI
jgi:hypothetical protein